MKYLLSLLLILAGSALCLRLGVWQLDRLAQKRAENAHYLTVSALPPLNLTAAPAEDLTTQEYRRVTVSGVYDFEHQVALRNHYRETELGYRLLTPLILSDGTAILVERGWIPAAGNASPADWRKYDQPGPITLSGILRLGRALPEIGGVPDPTLQPGQTRLDFWNIVTIERLALQTPARLLPAYIQPDPDESRAAPPYPAQEQYEVTERNHFSYALQWFSFAALLFFGGPLFLYRQSRRPQGNP
ncbi:MAG: SURF1 family protein [Anaerolineales bacterium]